MSSNGTFTISLDFELFWGVRANRTLESYQDNLVAVYTVIPKILALFKKYNIHATWATVGFLFYDSIEEIQKDKPSMLPNYIDKKVDPYIYLDTLKPPYSKEFSKMHTAKKLISLIASTPNQELATHTYSHFFTYEPLKSKKAFEIDISKAIEVAKKRGYSLKSLVFPRNQIDTNSINSLKSLNISTYRGNPTHWAYSDGDKPSKSTLLRLYRLVDTYINISGHHCSKPKSTQGVMELKSSIMLRPYFPKLSFLEKLKIYRIKRAMRYSAIHKENFHLWWHPHNFGENQEKNLKNLEELLIYFQKLKDDYRMLSLTMEEVKEYVK